MCCEISELFTRAGIYVARYLSFTTTGDVCVARYLVVYYSRLMCCEIFELFTRADVCVARCLIFDSVVQKLTK